MKIKLNPTQNQEHSKLSLSYPIIKELLYKKIYNILLHQIQKSEYKATKILDLNYQHTAVISIINKMLSHDRIYVEIYTDKLYKVFLLNKLNILENSISQYDFNELKLTEDSLVNIKLI